MPHTKSLHNCQGDNLSASTKLSNNPEQSAPKEQSGQDYQIAFFIILDQQTGHSSPPQTHSTCKAIDECLCKNNFLSNSSANSRQLLYGRAFVT